MIAFGAICLGVLLGLACGGSVRALGEYHLRFEIPILVLFVIQALARGRLFSGVAFAPTIVWGAASIGLIVMLAFNFRSPGVLMAAAGVLLNLDATLLNSGMPVFYGQAAESAAKAIQSSGGQYRLADPSTVLALLGDVVSLRIASSTYLLSVGDVLLAVGVVATVTSAMCRAGRAQQRWGSDYAD